MKCLALMVLLSQVGCTAAPHKNEQFSDYSLTTSENVKQGFYEEFLFVSKNYRGIDLRLVVDRHYPGEWLPLVGIGLSDALMQRDFRVKFIMQESSTSLAFELYDGKKKILDESVALSKTPETVEMTWEDKVVTVRVEGREFVFEMPFEITFIRNSSSSLAVTKSFRLLEK